MSHVFHKILSDGTILNRVNNRKKCDNRNIKTPKIFNDIYSKLFLL